MSYLPPQIDHVGDVGGPRTAHVEAVRVGGPINRGRPRPTSGDDSDHVGGSATAHVPNPWKQRRAQRLARMGGLHRPSSAADDKRYLAEQLTIDAQVLHGRLPSLKPPEPPGGVVFSELSGT